MSPLRPGSLAPRVLPPVTLATPGKPPYTGPRKCSGGPPLLPSSIG